MSVRDIRINVNIELIKKVEKLFWENHPHLENSYVPIGAIISYGLMIATEKK